MIVNVYGRHDTVPAGVIKKAVTAYAEYLMKPRVLDDLQVDVDFERIYPGDAVVANISGEGPARDFEITMARRGSKKKTLLSLAHEMRHVEQLATGRLVICSTGRRWKRKRYAPRTRRAEVLKRLHELGLRPGEVIGALADANTKKMMLELIENVKYMLTPWEKEAYATEKDIYRQYRG